jgi:hypothetical protein
MGRGRRMNAPKKIFVPYAYAHAWAMTTKAEGDVKYVRADLVNELAKALFIALNVFRVYQAHHEAKGDEKKAEANKGYAEQMEAALAKLEEE